MVGWWSHQKMCSLYTELIVHIALTPEVLTAPPSVSASSAPPSLAQPPSDAVFLRSDTSPAPAPADVVVAGALSLRSVSDAPAPRSHADDASTHYAYVAPPPSNRKRGISHYSSLGDGMEKSGTLPRFLIWKQTDQKSCTLKSDPHFGHW